jgi:hypothetical protein
MDTDIVNFELLVLSVVEALHGLLLFPELSPVPHLTWHLLID